MVRDIRRRLEPGGSAAYSLIYEEHKEGYAMKDKGFTLIELMISVVILTFMIAGMTIAFQQQQRQLNFTKEAADIDQTVRSSIDFLATEIRNSASRQGKSFALEFFNGGSGTNCTTDTDQTGVDSPPDCFTVFTWDITRGQNGNNLPSVPAVIQVSQQSPSLQLVLPPQWFEGGILIGEQDEPGDPEILLGLRSRVNLCNPDSTVSCGVSPEECTECAVIVRANVNESTQTATIDSLSDLKEENFPISSYGSLSEFISGTAVGNITYGVIPTFAAQPSEMTIVNTKTFMVNSATRELELSINGDPSVAVAGGVSAPGVVDLQLVFNLQDQNGEITKVGVPLSAADNKYPDFSDSSLLGREQDIRSVEIHVVVRSKLKPQKIKSGKHTQTLPAIGDVSVRTTEDDSIEPEEGYIYRTLSTTIYMRNHSREEFG